jgi:hypothetical protein
MSHCSLAPVVAALMLVVAAGTASAQPDDFYRNSVIVSNEGPGHLIDELIQAGYGDDTLFEVLGLLQPVSGGAIPASFVALVAGSPSSRAVFNTKLSDFAGVSGGVEIDDDGTIESTGRTGLAWYGSSGHLSNTSGVPGVVPVEFTYADGGYYWEYTHSFDLEGGIHRDYYLMAVVWARQATEAVPAVGGAGLAAIAAALLVAGMVLSRRSRNTAPADAGRF